MKATYPLTITPTDNGFVVQAGCMTLVFTCEQLRSELWRWLSDPQAVEAEYRRRYRPNGPALMTGDFEEAQQPTRPPYPASATGCDIVRPLTQQTLGYDPNVDPRPLRGGRETGHYVNPLPPRG